MKKSFFLILVLIVLAYYFLFMQNEPIGTIIQKQEDVKIIYPKDLQEVKEIINVQGISNNFESVEVQVDLNGWKKATGLNNWNYLLDTSELEPGLHTIYARAFNKTSTSKTKAVRIKVNK